MKPPVPADQLPDMIEGILDDHTSPSGHVNGSLLADALAESWLKDRRRAVAQAMEKPPAVGRGG